MPSLSKEQLQTLGLLLIAAAVLGGLFYLTSPGPVKSIYWGGTIFEGLFFFFILFWNAVILPHGRSSKILCLGSLLLLLGSYADFFDNFFIQPRWQDWGVQDLSMAVGAALFGLGLWYWDEEKEALLDQIKRDRDLEKALVPKLSHDLRIPLRNVSDAVQRLDRDPDIAALPAARAPLDAIHKGVREVRLQMENIVEAHWLKSGGTKLRSSTFGIVQLFDETADEFRYQAEEKSIAIVKKCPAGEIFVMADRLRVRRIVQNLLDNAIKHCPATGTVVLAASTDAEELVLRVIDEGRGISQELAQKITQGSALSFGRDNEHESAGLGLSIVRDFVQMHRGRFWVEPNSPSGAQFCISLPLTSRAAE
jgi:signal transduction histidine kinase